MADQDKSLPIATDSTSTSSIADLKGKGKASDAAVQDVSMDEDEDTSEDDTAAEEEIPEEPEEEDADNMETIDTDNIIPDGRRTRGTKIDWAKAAETSKTAGDDLDDDEDDDEDFEEDESMQD